MKKGIISLVLMGLLMIISSGTSVDSVFGKEKEIKLDPPAASLNIDLIDALKSRHSSRDFLDKTLSPRDLSTVLWAADGVNRENGKRTAPAPYGKNVVAIYVAMKQGVYLFEPVGHKLISVSDKTINGKIGSQGDIAKASHVLILVGKINEFPFIVRKEDRLRMANATAGTIAQNVYLAANALQLGTRLVEGLNQKEIKETLDLKDDEIPLYIMPLGYPKE